MDKFKAIIKKIFAPFLDVEFDPDPYKIFGIGLLVVAAIMAFIVLGKLGTVQDAAVFAAAAGLVATVGGYGVFLLGQGRKADDSLLGRKPTKAPE